MNDGDYSWRASSAQHLSCTSGWADSPCQLVHVKSWAQNPANPLNQPPKDSPEVPGQVGNAGSVGGVTTVLMVHTKVFGATEYRYEFWTVDPNNQQPTSSPVNVIYSAAALQLASANFWAMYVGGVPPLNGYVFEMQGGDLTQEYGWRVKACNVNGCGPFSASSFWQQNFPWDAVWAFLNNQ